MIMINGQNVFDQPVKNDLYWMSVRLCLFKKVLS